MNLVEMWVQITNNNSAKCRICGKIIKKSTDKYRLYCWASRQGVAFFHIGCIMKVAGLFINIDLDKIFETRSQQKNYPISQIRIDGL